MWEMKQTVCPGSVNRLVCLLQADWLTVTVLQVLSLSYTLSEKISHRSIIADPWFRPRASPREIGDHKQRTRVLPSLLSVSLDQLPALFCSFIFLSLDKKAGQGLGTFKMELGGTEMCCCFYWRSSKTELCLRRLVAGLRQRKPRFLPEQAHVGLLMDKVALRRVCVPVLRFPAVSIVPTVFQSAFSSFSSY